MEVLIKEEDIGKIEIIKEKESIFKFKPAEVKAFWFGLYLKVYPARFTNGTTTERIEKLNTNYFKLENGIIYRKGHFYIYFKSGSHYTLNFDTDLEMRQWLVKNSELISKFVKV